MIAVQVVAFFIAVQTFDGVGINFIATDIIVKVIRNKQSNGIKTKSNLSIVLQPVCSGPTHLKNPRWMRLEDLLPSLLR